MADTHEIAVTIIGADQPGIIAAMTGALTGVDGNIEDSSMTILRGHFAMTLIVRTWASVDQVRAAVEPPASSLRLLVDVREVAEAADPGMAGPTHMLVVQGADRPQIVARIMAVVAAHGGNVTDLTTRLVGTMYLLAAEVQLPLSADVDALSAELAAVAATLGVDAALRPAEADVL
jgi:glycine cleavage system transcriptional repressor